MKKPDNMPPVPLETVTVAEVEEAGLPTEQMTAQITEPTNIEARGDRITTVLSEKEIAEIKEKARADIAKKKRDHAKAQLLQQEIDRLMAEEGVGGIEDDTVNILISLPVYADRITINGRPYHHGRSYPVSRHLARTLSEIMWRAKKHDAKEIKGTKDVEFYRRPRITQMSSVTGATFNAPTSIGGR